MAAADGAVHRGPHPQVALHRGRGAGRGSGSAGAGSRRRRRPGRRAGTAAARPPLSTSTVQSPTSTSPVGRLALTVPSGRGAHRARDPHDVLACGRRRRRRPRTARSGRCGRAGRRRRGARRARAGVPPSRTRRPPVADVVGAQVAAVVGAHARARSAIVAGCLASSVRRRASSMRGTVDLVARRRRRSRDRDGAVRPPRCSPTITRQPRARAVGRLHLGLHRPAVEGPVGAEPGPRAARR